MDRADELRFEAFVHASAPLLLRTAFLLTGDRGHAEDLLQQALERTARKWNRLDGAPEAYARVVIVNLARDRWRRRKARVSESPVAEVSDAADAHDHADHVATRDALITALRLLPRRQRAVVVLRYFDQLTEAETAQALSITVGTVKSTSSRALSRLRELLPDLASDDDAPLVTSCVEDRS
ncbi:MAG TPA: SigE family RNA polymerase sigma factor [Mycobacteriales bacterium]|nr:SigE family RNA polymerase sigma factor [Mycobacteriales bacterium]